MLVVGGGLAALSAAISAADNGATVLLVNKGIPEILALRPRLLGFWLQLLATVT